jgi:hypothetical protein
MPLPARNRVAAGKDAHCGEIGHDGVWKSTMVISADFAGRLSA